MKSIFAMLAIAVLVTSVFAQAPTGKITGKATDKDGGPLPGVSVTADSPRLVGTAAAVSDELGVYRLFSLPAGTYSVRFTLPGFKTVTRREIVLGLEQTLTLNMTLDQSALNEEVTVVGQSPLIDVKSTTKGSTMNKEVFMQLPRNRDFTGLLATVPGVQYEGNQGGLSVDGASGTENMFYIDGTNISTIRIGLQGQSIVMEQLEEVKVSASGYSAEFGGSMGGVVNVISRSGGNEFHADAFGYYNNGTTLFTGKVRDSLRLSPYYTNPITVGMYEYINSDDLYFGGGKKRDDYQRMEGVFNLSGFVIKDKLWFFGSFNPIYSRTYGDRFFTTDPVNLAIAKIPGDTAFDPRQGRDMYNFYRKDSTWNWQGKLTAALFPGMRISVSAVGNPSSYVGSIPSIAGTSSKYYSYRPDWNPINPSTGVGLLTAGKQPGFDYPSMSGSANVDYTVSNNFLVSLRGGYFKTDQNNQQLFVPGTRYAFSGSNKVFPEIVANRPDLIHDSGWNNGAGTTLTQRYIQERTSANLDLTYYLTLAGEHSWKAGFQYIRLHEDVLQVPLSPWVDLSWNTEMTKYDGTKVKGTYGYYTLRNDWVSSYGSDFNVASNNWAIYLQDSWTIGQKLTLNLGVRTESEYVPSLAYTDPKYKDYRPIQFGFDKKLAPRLGVVYDVFGDSSLKVFASYGRYYDVMKLYMAEGAYGGFKWWSSYYTLDNYDFTKIAASGDPKNKADQAMGGLYMGSTNARTVSWDTTDTDLKPVSQDEFSFGAEKKISEELSFSARFVYKHLIRTIEDVGVLMTDAQGNQSEEYYIANPGEGWVLPVGQGTGRFDPKFWPSPKPKREYLGLNLALEKRFSNNWQGGFNYTWSSMKGNYGGLSSSDENGRNSPNVERYWDLWFERYDIRGNALDGPLPSDRSHYFKVYGSYAFPFGLTAGVVAYGRSGLPLQTNIAFTGMQIFPDNYTADERLPFLFTADLYLEYNLRIAKKYTINLNATVSNFTNTSTVTGYNMRYNNGSLVMSDDAIIAQKTNYIPWKTLIDNNNVTNKYNLIYHGRDGKDWWTGKNGPMSWRLGARVSF